MVSVWPRPLSAKPTEPSADVCDGKETLALCTSDTELASARSINAAYEVSKHTVVPIALVLVPHTTKAYSGWQHTKNMCCEEA
jgi:hypothetical protein